VASGVDAVDPVRPDPVVIERAATILRAGGLVAFPTETVYGLGADGLDPSAVARIYRAKGRPAADPLILHVASADGLAGLARSVPAVADRLVERFWPGPLTLVVPRGGHVPRIVSGGRDTVAVRMPQHAVALALIEATGVPVAAPSANRFGRVSPTTAADVVEELGPAVDIVLDGGPCRLGLESTVLDLTSEVPRVLRPGAVTVEELREVVPRVDNPTRGIDEAPAAPGRYLRHYAPGTPLVLVEGPDAPSLLARLATAVAGVGVSSVVLGLAGDPAPDGVRVIDVGAADDPAGVARQLYGVLRRADALGARLLLARTVPERGLGAAINDRLYRAAQGRTIHRVDAGVVADLVALALPDA